MRVPWLPKEKISAHTSDLLDKYEKSVGNVVKPPIPVEDIIERHLGLYLSYENLDEELGDHVLGATFIKKKKISINTKLLEDNPEGRIVYTCAHEVGHWELHRNFIEQANRNGKNKQTIICRTHSEGEPIEWQADYFASCLLMPESYIRKAFHNVCGPDVLILANLRPSINSTSIYVEPCVQNWHLIAELIIEKGRFINVSKQALFYRLQDLGLIINKSQTQIGWFVSRNN